MAHSSRLRLRDIESAHRIANECRELWADPSEWRQHLVIAASRFTGMAVAHYGEFLLKGAAGRPQPICHADVGWRDARARQMFLAAVSAHPNTLDFFPGFDPYMSRLLSGKQVAALRVELCDDGEWRRSTAFNDFRQPAYLDDNAVSAMHRDDGVVAVLDVSQDVADLRPSRRTKRQLALLHRLIEPLVGVELTSECQRGAHGLTPQLRATLERMLKGQTEKRIASDLGLTHSTVHEYIGKVYRHFGVTSRPELMAYFIRRRPTQHE